jgi:glycosyltransferase involved in cell wall biosynthesis
VPKIAFLLDSYAGGGSERAALEIIRHLEGFQRVLGVLNPRGPLKTAVPEGIRAYDLSTANGGRTSLSGRVIGTIETAGQIRAFIRDTRPDLLVGTNSNVNRLVYRAFVGRRVPCRVVAVEQNNLVRKLSGVSTSLRRWARGTELRRAHLRADRVIAVSAGLKQQLVTHFSVPGERVNVIYNPVDVRAVAARASERDLRPWSTVPPLLRMMRFFPMKF